MTTFRFLAGVGAGAAMVALVVGAASVGPGAAEPDVTAPARVEPKARAAAAQPPRAAPAKKAPVEPGVLARAASRKAKLPETAAAKPSAPAPAHAAVPEAPHDPANGSKDAVIQSVEVDWGAAQPRP